MAKELKARRGDELRIICPLCETTWSTNVVPDECPTCAATVTITAKKKRQ